jgi:hypothetical protein
MLLEKAACTWTQGLAIGSDKAKDATNVATVGVTATRGTGNGAHVSTMESGDKFFVSYRYRSAMKDGKPGETSGKWSFTGGTGKVKGVKGEGSERWRDVQSDVCGGWVVDGGSGRGVCVGGGGEEEGIGFYRRHKF